MPDKIEYPRICETFFNQPWAITQEKLWEMEAFIRAKARGAEPPPMPEPAAGPRPQYQVAGKTALIPVFGVLAQRMSLMTAISGGTSTEQIGRQVDAAAADKAIRSILLVIDSPGGSVFGTAELANKIFQARQEKKVLAIADSMAASAAYWIGSQANEVIVTPGGQVGSVGVVAAHTDLSKAEEMAGVKTTLVHAGRYKVEGDPSMPFSAEAKDNLQGMVDQYYGMFVNAVARGRGVTPLRVEKDFGQGRMKLAKEAVELNMADRVATLEQTLSRLGADQGGNGAATMAYVNAMADSAKRGL